MQNIFAIYTSDYLYFLLIYFERRVNANPDKFLGHEVITYEKTYIEQIKSKSSSSDYMSWAQLVRCM